MRSRLCSEVGLNWGLLLCALSLGACQLIGNGDGRTKQTSVANPQVPVAPVFSVATPPSAAPLAVASAAVAARNDYSEEGLAPIVSDCVDPAIVMMAVPKTYYESDTFDFRHVRQVALANPDFEIVSALLPSSKPASIAFVVNEHLPTRGVALVAHCKTAATCRRFAAAYRTVVPTATLTPICGKNPNIGPRITGGKSVLPPSGSISGVLPDRKDVQSQCVRLAACKAAKEHSLSSDETQACMKKPSTFKLQCSLRKTCDEVRTCVGE